MDTVLVSSFPSEGQSSENVPLDVLAGLLNANGLVLAALASGKSVAYGQDAVTGSLTKVTGLGLVETVIASVQDDLTGTTILGCSATKGDQNGAPAAGSIILKCWKATASGNVALIAATAAFTVSWIAIGTR